MSTQLIDRNDDLRRLRDDNYNITIIEGNVVIRGIPYVNSERKILFGSIYCPLNLSGDQTVPPQDHTVRFVGEHPCDQFGQKYIERKSFVNSYNVHILTPDIVASFYFSSIPNGRKYTDFYEKMTTYIHLLSGPAKSIDPGVSAQNFDEDAYKEDSVFKYTDTYTARAEISQISNKIRDQRIAIVGLGGTGSYILDFVSKTPVRQISLFDGDHVLNHNAFRMPGTMKLQELKERPTKVSYFFERYDHLRNGIVKHEVFIDEANVTLLNGHDFVFLSIDESDAKLAIVQHLIASGIPFVDLGMGVTAVENSLRGTIRKTLVTPDNTSYVNKIPIAPTDEDDIYSQNIQIPELNALNAILGVIAWKKLNGYYATEADFFNSIFIVDEEEIINET